MAEDYPQPEYSQAPNNRNMDHKIYAQAKAHMRRAADLIQEAGGDSDLYRWAAWWAWIHG